MSSNNFFTILGCGHSESLRNFNNNALVSSESGNMLIDCGYTIKHALHASGLNIADIDDIYISHVHGDHVFGLERVAYESKFKYNKKIRLIFHESLYEELWEQTLKGSLGRNSDGICEFDDYFDIVTITNNRFSSLGNDYKIFPVEHTPGKPAYGLVLAEQILYTTDTIAIPEVIKKQNFNIGFHDVTLTNYNPVHASIDSLVEKYSYDLRKKLYLMSYEDDWEDFENLVDEKFGGFAKQGMKIPYE